MIYRIHCSSGNTIEIDEFVSYSEIDAAGCWNRYIEVRTNGTAFRYSREHDSDIYGVLPEGVWDEHEASLSKYGTTIAISSELFEAVWVVTRCVNREYK